MINWATSSQLETPLPCLASASHALSLGLPSFTLPQTCLLILLVGGPLTILLALSLRQLRPALLLSRTWRSILRDDHATATIEFTMVFPILLFLIMLLTQSTLLMGATMVCNHAAFAAARSAVVVVPTNEAAREEPYNTVIGFDYSYKTQRIRKAAVMAVLPIAGRLETTANGQLDPLALADGLRGYYMAHNHAAPAWIDNLMADRLRYADANTRVTLLRTRVVGSVLELTPIDGQHTFGPRDPITVQVQHRMNLALPYVGQLFADGRHETVSGNTLYTNITTQCTLPNEGIINALPPAPALERIP